MNYMTNKIIAIQGDSPSKLNAETDTSIFLANEIQSKRYNIFYFKCLRNSYDFCWLFNI